MAFTTPRTWTYGETVTEAQFNEQLRDNFNAVWVGTTAGDIDYYTSNTTKARLAGGTANAGKYLRMDSGGTAPEWAGVAAVSYRYGGSADNWLTPGTVEYQPSETMILMGATTVSIAGVLAKGTIVFARPFANPPQMRYDYTPITGSGALHNLTIHSDDKSVSANSETVVFAVGAISSTTASLEVYWTATGQPA